ncbi:MAG: hypothetical protein RJA00_1563 [Bacteroidota bacterium]|jgi:uncharacterized membrane protein YfcA|nr:sulfite exporter TauE/SafE family protein [Bacteroidota bacterium]
MDLFTHQILPFLLLLLCGSVGGFLAGLLGVGGGMLFIPVINEYLSSYPLTTDELVKYTLANSIALVFMSGVSGIFRQKKMGTWDWKQSLYIGIPGALSSLAMSMAIEQGDWYSKTRFQTVFLGFLLLSIANMIWGKTAAKSTDTQVNDAKTSPILPILVGIIAGCVVSLSGLGGGIIMVPLFRMLLKKPMHQATALSLSIVPILAIASLLQYGLNAPSDTINPFQWGYLLGILLLPMLLGVMFFSSFGQKTAPRVPVLWLRVIFAVLSSIILIKTLIEINS